MDTTYTPARKAYYEANKEYYKQKNAEYRELHKDKLMAYSREYHKTYRVDHHDTMMIAQWKNKGIVLQEDEDWDSVYMTWRLTNNCEACDCVLTDGLYLKTKRCLDHSHETGFIRGIICHQCNIIAGFDDRFEAQNQNDTF